MRQRDSARRLAPDCLNYSSGVAAAMGDINWGNGNR